MLMFMFDCITPGGLFDPTVIVVVLSSLTTELSPILNVLCLISQTPVTATVTRLFQCVFKVCFMLCL